MSRRWISAIVSLAAVGVLAVFSGPALAAPVHLITETPSPTPTSPATPAPVRRDPALTKAVDVQAARVGDLVAYTLTASNPNDADIAEVTVVDPLPAQVDFVDAVSSQGTFVYDPAKRTLTFSLWRLQAGATATMVIHARVNSSGLPGSSIRNTATVNGLPSNTVEVLVIPGALPASGQPLSQGLVLGVLALVALLLMGAPLAARTGWRRLGR